VSFLILPQFRVCAWLIDGFWIGWSDLLTPHTHHSELLAITALLLFPHYTVYHYTNTSILSLLHSPLVVSWQRIHNSLTVITYEVFFAQPNSLIVSILRTTNSGTQLNSNSSCERSLLYSLGAAPHRKHHFPYSCMLIHCCRDVFAAQLHSNERSTDPQRTPLATPLLLLRDITAYMTRSSAACVRAIT
jgi:hypothetical protein